MTTGAAGVSGLLGRRYRVIGRVGRGAIAEVLRARDERTGKDVALKVLYPHLAENAAVVERFRREVEIVRRIQHRHVLAIHDVVASAGRPFLVMDYHPGGDLADRLARQGNLAPAEVRVLATQLCGALAAAHRAGVVHRDVKPSNVLCGPGPGFDVRLCDFGLARTGDLAGLTTASAVLGTPEYMAPEVITDGHADPRSDIYSLGVMLFEAVTGRLPFYGDSPYQLMRQHVDVAAESVRDLAPDVSPQVDRAIARALAKDPLDRFGTADDLLRALTADADGATPVTLEPRREAPLRSCWRCGGWVVDGAGVCADCGAAELRLEREPGGVAVMVTGPGKIGDKLDAHRHVALYEILDEASGGATTVPRKRRKAPRVPFYAAKGLTRSSATALCQRLEAIGLESQLVDLRSPLRDHMRTKVWRLSLRYLAAAGIGLNSAHLWQLWIRLPMHLWWVVGAGTVSLLGIGAALSYRGVRPLIADGAGRPPPNPIERRLGGAMLRLTSRQDRRLLGRILERLEQVEARGHAELATPAADRAAHAAEGLVALEALRSQDAPVTGDSGRAVQEIRREERIRVVLRATLLRVASRLDDLLLAVTRADALGSRAEMARLEQEVQDLAIAVDAEEELGLLLDSRR